MNTEKCTGVVLNSWHNQNYIEYNFPILHHQTHMQHQLKMSYLTTSHLVVWPIYMTIPVDMVGGGGRDGVAGGFVCWPQATSTCKMKGKVCVHTILNFKHNKIKQLNISSNEILYIIISWWVFMIVCVTTWSNTSAIL